MTKLRLTAAVAALTLAGYAGSALAQQTAPADPTAQTTQSAPFLVHDVAVLWHGSRGRARADPAADASASGTPSSATAADTSTDAAAPAADAKPDKKAKKHHKPAGNRSRPRAPSSDDAQAVGRAPFVKKGPSRERRALCLVRAPSVTTSPGG
jgi:hypothetical protein